MFMFLLCYVEVIIPGWWLQRLISRCESLWSSAGAELQGMTTCVLQLLPVLFTQVCGWGRSIFPSCVRTWDCVCEQVLDVHDCLWVCVCNSIALWPLPVMHRRKLASVPHSQSDKGDDISSTPLRMNSHQTNTARHIKFSQHHPAQ